MISNDTTKSNLEKETATASNSKEITDAEQKKAEIAMYANQVTNGEYTISQAGDKFNVSGGSLTEGGGTPADCVKVALGCLMTEKPDIVFSGINAGYNVGRDILYSGTIGAAMEALCGGVPAIAFSVAEEDECEVLDAYLEPVAKELISKKLPENEIWNVNFPGCTLEEYKGILWDRIPDQNQYYRDNYKRTDRVDGSCIFSAAGLPETEAADGTDAGCCQLYVNSSRNCRIIFCCTGTDHIALYRGSIRCSCISNSSSGCASCSASVSSLCLSVGNIVTAVCCHIITKCLLQICIFCLVCLWIEIC